MTPNSNTTNEKGASQSSFLHIALVIYIRCNLFCYFCFAGWLASCTKRFHVSRFCRDCVNARFTLPLLSSHSQAVYAQAVLWLQQQTFTLHILLLAFFVVIILFCVVSNSNAKKPRDCMGQIDSYIYANMNNVHTNCNNSTSNTSLTDSKKKVEVCWTFFMSAQRLRWWWWCWWWRKTSKTRM